MENKPYEREVRPVEILDQRATHLHNVSENLIGDGVLLLDVGELLAEPERVGLEMQVGVLAAGNLVLVHVGVAGPNIETRGGRGEGRGGKGKAGKEDEVGGG